MAEGKVEPFVIVEMEEPAQTIAIPERAISTAYMMLVGESSWSNVTIRREGDKWRVSGELPMGG